MYSHSGQPFGRRSDSPSDDVADSPSGGPSEPEQLPGQPFGRTPETRTVTRTALRAEERNYNLSTGLHTYDVSYPVGLRRPELVPAGTQTAFRLYEKLFSWEGERELAKLSMCMRARMRFGAASPPLFIGKPRGKSVIHKTPKCPWNIPFIKGICHMGVPCGAPWCPTSLAGHPWGPPPHGGALAPKPF